VYQQAVTTKKELLVQLLSEGHVFVQLDGRADGVELPDFLRGDPAVVLQLGYDMPVPIPDLAVDDAGIVATLSFRRTPHRCVVPWAAVYGMGDGEGRRMVFPESVPMAMAPVEPTSEKGPPEEDPSPPKPTRRASHLKLVK
jgi:hypothetical protein